MPTTINPSDQTITQYNIQTGGSSNLLNSVAPSSTSGVPVISQGSSSQPIFGTAVVAGGGTGNASATAYALLAGGTTSTGAFQSLTTGSSGSVLQSGGSSALPTWVSSASVGSMVYLTTVTASSSASLSFSSTYITNTYGTYLMVVNNLIVANVNDSYILTFSTDNGSTYLATNYNAGVMEALPNAGTWFAQNSTTNLPMGGAQAANSGTSGTLYFTGLRGSGFKYMTGMTAANNASTIQIDLNFGWQSTATAINNIKITATTGNITSGTIDLYGIIN